MSKVSNNSENTNYNHVSVKTDSMVKMIKELSKLGVFKGKSKPRAKRGSGKGDDMGGDDMGGAGPQMRNLPPIQQIPQGATTQQIQDIQQQNAAAFAQLRAEAQQGRIPDIQGSRFRSQQEAGAGVYNPFENTRSIGIMVPDVTEGGFTQTLNEGGPEAISQLQETTFPVEETANIPVARLQPIERIAVGEAVGVEAVGVEAVKTGGGSRPSLSLRKSVTDYFGLPPIPGVRGADTVDVLIYYRQFMDKINGRVDESIVTSKEKMIKEMNSLADTLVQKI
jgi:hypothetical protein